MRGGARIHHYRIEGERAVLLRPGGLALEEIEKLSARLLTRAARAGIQGAGADAFALFTADAVLIAAGGFRCRSYCRNAGLLAFREPPDAAGLLTSRCCPLRVTSARPRPAVFLPSRARFARA